MPETILILGGTKEAADIAANLVKNRPDARIITSLAGRTKEPMPVSGEVRIGGFGGIDGLVSYLTTEHVDRVIDATHPFAMQISANASQAARRANVPLEIHTRDAWQKQPGDDWAEVATLEEACAAIPSGSRVLLALGSQHIAPFAGRADVHFTVRMVDAPATSLPLTDYTLLTGLPGKTATDEAGVLKDHRITHIVCRNSGGTGAYAKIEAARSLSIPVIMIARPR